MSEAAPERPLRSVEEPKADMGVSVLGQLQDRREQIKKAAFIDLPVPRWDSPVIVVRYNPVDHTRFRAAATQVEKVQPNRRAEVEVNVNSDILIGACLGVFAVINGKRYSLKSGDADGEWTKFDPDLAAAFGMPEGATARSVLKTVYITEGDILSTANKLAEFSGYKEQEVDDSILGE